MTRTFILVTVLALAGCVETANMDDSEVVGVPPPVTGGDQNAPAALACRTAIAKQTGRPVSDVAVFDVSESEAGVGVMATVSGAEEPWSCQSSPEGRVAGVMYTGSEGRL